MIHKESAFYTQKKWQSYRFTEPRQLWVGEMQDLLRRRIESAKCTEKHLESLIKQAVLERNRAKNPGPQNLTSNATAPRRDRGGSSFRRRGSNSVRPDIESVNEISDGNESDNFKEPSALKWVVSTDRCCRLIAAYAADENSYIRQEYRRLQKVLEWSARVRTTRRLSRAACRLCGSLCC